MKKIVTGFFHDIGLKRKLLLKMKLTLIGLILCFMQVSASVYSQATKFELNMKEKQIEEVLREIEKTSNYRFFYQREQIDVEKIISIKSKEKTIDQILTTIFKNEAVEYKVMDNDLILLTPSGSKLANRIAQQKKSITGIVTDENGETLPGVTVVVKGTSNGTVTDMNGKYALDNIPSDAILQFSFVGMKTQEITLGNQSSIDVQMEADAIGLEEVVAVGYGVQKKVNLTGSVAQVSSEEIENRAVTNVSQALQGVVPNLNATVSSAGSEPGAGFNLNIRGDGSLSAGDGPYILIDGVPQGINTLNPDDIESVSVLKDASASAIYGARAAYGVILITTKKGQKRERQKVTYSTSFTWASPTNLPDPVNSLDFALTVNEMRQNNGQGDYFAPIIIDRIKAYIDDPVNNPVNYPQSGNPNIWGRRNTANANVNYVDELYKDHAVRQKHDLSLTGGSEKTSYYFSTSFFDDPGLFRWGEIKFNRYNLNFNLHTQVNSQLAFELSNRFSKRSTTQPSGMLGGYSGTGIIYHQFLKQFPTNPVRQPDGNLGVEFADLENGGKYKNNQYDNWLTGKLIFEPVKDWVINGDVSWQLYNSENQRRFNTFYVYLVDGTPVEQYASKNRVNKQFVTNNYYSTNIYSSYTKKMADHNFKIMAGFQAELSDSKSLYGERYGLITDDLSSLSIALGENMTVDDNLGHWSTAGFFGRFNYNYKEKFLFEVNGRYDGSSRFEDGKRWGMFPSFSAGYNISKEDFWAPLQSTINNLKLRGSYGSLGNQNVANYLYLPRMNVGNKINYIFGGERPPYVNAPGLTSADLTWETSTTIDFGLDANLFENRMGIVFDWFKRTTTDMFGPSEKLPAYLGTGVPKSNNAELETKGFELTLTWKDRIGEDFSYSASLSMADNVSKVKKFYNPTKILSNHYEGKELGEIWGYSTVGYFQSDDEVSEWHDQSYISSKWQAGDIKYEDLNGDKKIDRGNNTLDDSGDLKVIGNSRPRYMYNANLSCSWKGFDLRMLWQGVGKRDVWLGNDVYFWLKPGLSQVVVLEEHMDHWTPDNPNAYYPRPYAGGAGSSRNLQVQSKYLQDASYIRLKNLQIGYTIPKAKLKNFFIKEARVYASGENLLTFSPISSIYDPEAIQGSWGSGKMYPLTKNITIGAKISF
ncbi:SusC/RagA family TonB-linked outer membrane protein [Puteibacter caeruleilacunae]|nr:SusC/RagA family TonB-linked outer membrane protein [Puteibacter caeruleilacunae]